MKRVYLALLVIAGIIYLPAIVIAQETNKLPRSTPEMEGVSSAAIIDFLKH